MVQLNEAYRVLADPGRRAVYDRSLDRSRASRLPDELLGEPEPPIEPQAEPVVTCRAGSGAVEVDGGRGGDRIGRRARLVLLQP